MTYKQIRDYAVKANVPFDVLNDAWNEVYPQPEKTDKGVIVVIIATFLLIMATVSYFVIIKTPGKEKSEVIKFSTGLKTSDDCLDIARQYADIWSSHYLFTGYSTDKASRRGAKTMKCTVNFLGEENGAGILIVEITEDRIRIRSQSNAAQPLLDSIYIGIPKLINSRDIIKKAKDTEGFKNDLKIIAQIMEKDEEELVEADSIYRKDGMYIWVIRIGDMVTYQFNASSGDFIKKDISEKGLSKLNEKNENELAAELKKIFNGEKTAEDFKTGDITASDCLRLANRRADIWSEDSRLLSLKMTPRENINFYTCEISYQSKEKNLSLVMFFDGEKVNYKINEIVLSQSDFWALKKISKIVDSSEIIDQIGEEVGYSKKISEMILSYGIANEDYTWTVVFAEDGHTIRKEAEKE